VGVLGVGPHFWETVYISEVNAATKLKREAQIATSENSDLVDECFLRGGWGMRSAPNP